jgi:hypothetical protein
MVILVSAPQNIVKRHQGILKVTLKCKEFMSGALKCEGLMKAKHFPSRNRSLQLTIARMHCKSFR